MEDNKGAIGAMEYLSHLCGQAVLIQSVSSTGQIIFIREVEINAVWLEGRHALHIIDTHTRFQNAVPHRPE